MPTTTVENYLKQIYQQQQQAEDAGGLALMGKLADAVGVAPGTATAMVKTLAQSGLVDYEPRSGVRLTEAGNRLALQVLRRHRLVELFLVEMLGLDWSEVHDEAEELEHAISDKVLDRIDALLGHPHSDPHGDPIPSRQGHPRSTERQGLANLLQCPVGRSLVVARVLDQGSDFLRFLDQHAMIPGASVTVVSREPAVDAVTVRPAGCPPVTLGASAAVKILVAPPLAG